MWQEAIPSNMHNSVESVSFLAELLVKVLCFLVPHDAHLNRQNVRQVVRFQRCNKVGIQLSLEDGNHVTGVRRLCCFLYQSQIHQNLVKQCSPGKNDLYLFPNQKTWKNERQNYEKTTTKYVLYVFFLLFLVQVSGFLGRATASTSPASHRTQRMSDSVTPGGCSVGFFICLVVI